MSDAIVQIADRARAVLALSDALEVVAREIEDERARHQRAMQALGAKKQALEDAIFKLGGKPE